MWSPAVAVDREFWLQWIRKYRSFRCLWDEDAKKQSDRTERSAAYQELVDIAKTVHPEANVLFVKNRFNSFRSCYRRERKKVIAAITNGHKYEPQLFYYDAMRFLHEDVENDYEETVANESETSDDDDPFNVSKNPVEKIQQREQHKRVDILPQKWEEIETYDDSIPNDSHVDDFYDEISQQTVSIQASEEKKDVSQNKRKQPTKEWKEFLDNSDDQDESDVSSDYKRKRKRSRRDDEFAILGKRIAEHFRKMESDQCLIAEKIISEVCIYGRMRQLTMQSGFIVDVVQDRDMNARNRESYKSNTGMEDGEILLEAEHYMQPI